jgi:hypothetical protein
MIEYTLKTGLAAVAVPIGCSVSIICYSLKPALGVAATALSMLTFGQIQCINNCANLTSRAHMILRPLSLIKLIVNPYAKKLLELNEKGIITNIFNECIYNKAREAAASEDSFWTKHFVSRGAYALAGLVSIISRTADLAIGLIATVISVIPCLGRSERVNAFAFRQLGALALIDDICISLRGIVNPQQFRRINTLSE